MKYKLINGIILDGTLDMQPIKNKDIIIEDDKIIKIEEHQDNNEGKIIDLNNQYIMPGLINLHVHIPADGIPKKKASDPKAKVKKITSNALLRYVGKRMCQNYAKIELMSGVTTIRAVGGVLNWDSYVRDRINSKKIVGPRILAANQAISVPGGHMAGSLAYECTSTKEAVRLVEKIAQDKPDLIKLMITGGVLDATKKGEPGVLRMPPEMVKAACDKAHELGFKVAAHVESPEGVKVALENGVDSIEHGAKANPEIIQLFKERKAALVTTISPALPYALFDQSISGASDIAKYNGKIVLDGIIDCARACLDNNIPVGLGTDTGCDYITHYNMWMELQLFHKYLNVSNSFALYTATNVNSQIVGIDNIVGTIEVNKKADLIVTKDNPLDNLKALKDVSMVISDGVIINHPKVKKNAEVEREMNKFLN